MSVDYATLGIRPVINASATLTRLGGSLMPSPVLDAMRSGATSFVDLVELQTAVGKRIAELTGNEACYVSSGAAAGMAISLAAVMVGSDKERVTSLPRLAGEPVEVIVFRSQRNGYDQAARTTGAQMIEIDGDGDALETAFSPRTAAVLFFAGAHFAADALPLEDVVAAAHAQKVPVVVDAAAQIPPISNLWHFTREMGADAAIFSGGKGLRGPQSSGLVLGKRSVIEACIANGPPNHSLGRPMKVGKEEMLGILAAVEWSLRQDEPSVLAGYEATVQKWVDGLAGLPGVVVERSFPSEAGQPHSRAIIRLSPESGWTRESLVKALWDHDPRIAVGEPAGSTDTIALNPQTLEGRQDEIVLKALRELLSR
jgi:L-seryl-tRNA(Ser) seleniumtransferase